MREDSQQNSGIGDGEAEFSERLLSSARDSIISNFPNPERVGCPESGVLEAVAFSSELPSESLRSHLLRCSPCFLLFTSLKSANSHISAAASQKSRALAAGAYSYGLIASIICITAIFGAMFFSGWMRSDSEVAQISDQTPPAGVRRDAATGAPSAGGSVDSPPNNPGSVSRPVPPKESLNDTLTLDVRQNSIVRGATSSDNINQARRRKTAVTLILAPDSPAGVYEVSVFDEAGRQLGPSLQRSSDGLFVSAVLDFSRVTDNVRVCVALSGEIPDCFPVMIRN